MNFRKIEERISYSWYMFLAPTVFEEDFSGRFRIAKSYENGSEYRLYFVKVRKIQSDSFKNCMNFVCKKSMLVYGKPFERACEETFASLHI